MFRTLYYWDETTTILFNIRQGHHTNYIDIFKTLCYIFKIHALNPYIIYNYVYILLFFMSS